MTAYSASGRGGFSHGATIYDTDAAFVATVAPFLAEGMANGDATLAALSPEREALVRSAFPGHPGVTFVSGRIYHGHPASTIRAYQDLFAGQLAAGASRIRIVGEAPHSRSDLAWGEWASYEAAINRAYETFPLWGLCAYDRRTTPGGMLDAAERTHPHLVTTGAGPLPNDRYEDPERFLAGLPASAPTDLEARAADLQLVDPLPATARHAIADLSREAGLGDDELDDLRIAVNEVVANAMVHGRPPTTVRAWATDRQVVVTVHDRGPGPSDPLAGLVPASGEAGEGGYGLWITRQLCPRVDLETAPDGFTVRLVVGAAAA
ncbi:MAG TPA: sensor histidine kinase [Acidimicrobiales bacterium]|nr:sensor histidine kinase [Acidimicrobiales bacterium]